MMKRFFYIFCLPLALMGCNMLMHADELIVLKTVADSQAALAKEVDKEDAQFETMLAEYKNSQLAAYTTRHQFIKAFGLPIFKRPYQHGSEKLEEWLYRYQVRFFHSPKIYIYFNEKGTKTDLRYKAEEEQPRK